MFMFNWNKPIKVAHLEKLANQPILNGVLVMCVHAFTCDRNGKQFFKWKAKLSNILGESNKNFGHLIKRETF